MLIIHSIQSIQIVYYQTSYLGAAAARGAAGPRAAAAGGAAAGGLGRAAGEGFKIFNYYIRYYYNKTQNVCIT